MKLTLWKSGYFRSGADPLEGAVPKSVPAGDPRAARYFSTAGRYNALATELGYQSLEHAIKAGRMKEILMRAALAAPATPPASPTREVRS